MTVVSSEDEKHYYAGWPGQALCEGKTTPPVAPITTIRADHVTCRRCKEMLENYSTSVAAGVTGHD